MLTSGGKCNCSRGGRHSLCFSRNCDVMCSDKFLTKIGVQCTLQGYACLLCEKIPIPVFLGCEKVPNFCLLVMWESIKNLSFLWCEKVPNSCLLVMWESTKFLSSCDVRQYQIPAFLWCEKVPDSCLRVIWESTKFLSSCDVRKYQIPDFLWCLEDNVLIPNL